jgi:hypothetical protein
MSVGSAVLLGISSTLLILMVVLAFRVSRSPKGRYRREVRGIRRLRRGTRAGDPHKTAIGGYNNVAVGPAGFQ